MVVCVFPSPTRPHYYKKLGLEEGVYIRVKLAIKKPPEMIQELNIEGNETFDEQSILMRFISGFLR
ncbi:hypothetical protein DIZ66_18600, partial [Legionella pneumophila]